MRAVKGAIASVTTALLLLVVGAAAVLGLATRTNAAPGGTETSAGAGAVGAGQSGAVVAGTAHTVREAADEPKLTVASRQAREGDTVAVVGADWQPESLVTVLLCGQNAIGGTKACANSDGRTATADAQGEFRVELPVVEPPRACPCVVRAVTVTGEHAEAQAEFKVAGHPVRALPEDRTGGERLAVLDARIEGSSGVLNWFGAAPKRELVLTVANQGTDQARNPVFEVGTAQGVFAPEWADQRWRGTLAPGDRKQVRLDVELDAGAYGDYRVSARYGQTVLAEQPWEVGRPWGLTLFVLLLVVVAAFGLYRGGRAVVRRARPHARRARERTTRPDGTLARFRDRVEQWQEPADDGTGPVPQRPRPRRKGPSLPWLAPDAGVPTEVDRDRARNGDSDRQEGRTDVG